MRAGPVRPPALHSIYMMRPARAVAFFVGEELMALRSEAVATASSSAALFRLGDLAIRLVVRDFVGDPRAICK